MRPAAGRRTSIACSSARTTRSVLIRLPKARPTLSPAYKSLIAARDNQPSAVGTYVMSAVHTASGRVTVKRCAQVRRNRQSVPRIGGLHPQPPLLLDAPQSEFASHTLDRAETRMQAVRREFPRQALRAIGLARSVVCRLIPRSAVARVIARVWMVVARAMRGTRS